MAMLDAEETAQRRFDGGNDETLREKTRRDEPPVLVDLATGVVATFTHYTPLSGAASGHRVWLTSGGTVVAAGWLSTALGSGMHLVSLGPAPHAWVRTTVDVGVCTGLVVSADGVCVAGTVGLGSLPPQIGLWMYEP